jgi:ArsR family metal-binding transcriptional regulator
MHVTVKNPQKIGNKNYKAGPQSVPDSLYGNQKFKKLVKSGHIIVHPRSTGDIAIQAQKDAQNQKKAKIAKDLTAKIEAAKAAGSIPSEIAAMVSGKA